MPGKLQQEIQQTRPFDLAEEEAVLNIVRTAEVAQRAISEFLDGFGLSAVQYNVLRILRGAGPAGATCSQIGKRMLTHDPDITRLLDRMEARGLIARARDGADRRAVITRITEAGLAVVGGIDRPLREFLQTRLGKFGRDGLASLTAQLEQVREAFGPQTESFTKGTTT
ncbi:MAG TPA: MarR family transcriptional regulator [Bryobacteraceae bacterium]|nr:MarR family transcriptional regulator [Bryobacteraceae bacterium]